MANNDPKILSPDEYQLHYYASPEGHLWLEAKKNLIPKTQTLTGHIESVDLQIYWQSRVTRTGLHSLEVPAQRGGVENSTSITQQLPQHTIPTSPIAQLPQGIDPNDPTLKGVLSDKRIEKSLLGKTVSSVSTSVSTMMSTPQINDNLNFDNSGTSSVASDSSNIVDFQATSKTNKDLRYTQQDLERIKADVEHQ